MATQEGIDRASQAFCQPLTVILNFSLFQYLLTVFLARRHELRVRVLLLAAFIGFAALVPFSYPDADLSRNLNDMSEVCSVLTFTQQIAILTRDINKKMKLPVIAKMGKVAELLVLLGLSVLIGNVVHIVAPEAAAMDTVELVDIVAEYVALAFVVGFRFYFLATVRGWAHIRRHQKLEMLFYLLLLIHAVPFKVLKQATGLNWHHVQGFWLRFAIAMCLSSTIRARLVSMGSRNGSKTTGIQSTDRKLNGQAFQSSVMPSDSHLDASQSEQARAEGGPDSPSGGLASKKNQRPRDKVAVTPLAGPSPSQSMMRALTARGRWRTAPIDARKQSSLSASKASGTPVAVMPTS